MRYPGQDTAWWGRGMRPDGRGTWWWCRATPPRSWCSLTGWRKAFGWDETWGYLQFDSVNRVELILRPGSMREGLNFNWWIDMDHAWLSIHSVTNHISSHVGQFTMKISNALKKYNYGVINNAASDQDRKCCIQAQN